MVGAGGEYFENLKSVHYKKNAVLEPLTIFSNPV